MRYGRIVTCACGCGHTGVNDGYGYVKGCYDRWKRAGRPQEGPPPPPNYRKRPPWIPERSDAVARMEDFRFLLTQGVTNHEALAARLGCSVRHVERLAAAHRALAQQQNREQDR